MIPVDSSNIKAVDYSSGTLTVQFSSGKTYRYEQVPQEVYDRLMDSPSKGAFFYNNIRRDFTGIPVDQDEVV